MGIYKQRVDELKVKETGCYDIETKISYKIECAFPQISVNQLFPQGITFVYNDISFSNLDGKIMFNNKTYNTIKQGIIVLIITGNTNFGMFSLLDSSTGDVVKGTFSNTNIIGNYLQSVPITLTGGIINGCVISAVTSQATLSTGSIISLQFVSDATIIDPNTMITLSYNGQVVLPYEPQIGLFNNDKLLYKSILPSLKINNLQLLYNVLLQLGMIGGTVVIVTTLTFVPVFSGMFLSLFSLLFNFPPPVIPDIPNVYIVLDDAEVVLGAKAELKCSDVLSAKLLDSNPFNLKLICKSSNFVLNKI
ncbi:MAG: hypothetical protein QW478_01095 [Candidatus Micrarchaeaceae archaeon]